ncbi:hypothetical protein [Staphylococcus caledonicus]|uniref:hypothetical protein n=1 Tax=Staphylococcus caledonicus TaxID=2741333 RepID=UPI0018E4117C|nr:hypothetical protein [Staphylococcus caledonicus]MBI5973924.1 hypothetical protein [Staphylococcus caledonicus]
MNKTNLATPTMFNKTILHLLKFWVVTTIISGIAVCIVSFLPSFFTKANYLELLFNHKMIFTLTIVSLVVSLVLVFLPTSTLSMVENYASDKSINFYLKLAKLFTYIFCILFIITIVLSIFSSIAIANNIHSFQGKVDNVTTSSLKSNGKTIKTVTVIDSNNQKYNFVPSDKIKNFNTNVNDNIKIDYSPFENSKNIEGTIVGYSSKSK